MPESMKIINPNRATNEGAAIVYVNTFGTYQTVDAKIKDGVIQSSGVLNSRFTDYTYYTA